LRAGVNFIQAWFAEIAERSHALSAESRAPWVPYPVAVEYDKRVWKNTRLPKFFDDYKRLEQELLLATLTRCGEEARGRGVTLVEVGCGTGRALLPTALAGEELPLEYVLGFDTSWGMLTKAVENLDAEMSQHAREGAALAALGHVSVCAMDARTMHLHFRDGEFLVGDAPALAWRPDADAVDRARFRSSRKVFACLLNTAGVLPDGERLPVLRNLVGALGIGDYAVVSVLDGFAFADGAEEFYGQIRGVTQSGGPAYESFDKERAVFRLDGQPEYFSRWFFRSTEVARNVERQFTVAGILDELVAMHHPTRRLTGEVLPIGEVGHFIRFQRAQ
jgi:SAM-dependent methyltransferase